MLMGNNFMMRDRRQFSTFAGTVSFFLHFVIPPIM